jgi:hypothetical protein
MLNFDPESLQARSELTRRGRGLFPFVRSDDGTLDSFDIDVRVATSAFTPPLERLRLAGSIFGSCHSCRCTGPGCR